MPPVVLSASKRIRRIQLEACRESGLKISSDNRGERWQPRSNPQVSTKSKGLFGRFLCWLGLHARDGEPPLVIDTCDYEDRVSGSIINRSIAEEMYTDDERRKYLRWVYELITPACKRCGHMVRIYNPTREQIEEYKAVRL